MAKSFESRSKHTPDSIRPPRQTAPRHQFCCQGALNRTLPLDWSSCSVDEYTRYPIVASHPKIRQPLLGTPDRQVFYSPTWLALYLLSYVILSLFTLASLRIPPPPFPSRSRVPHGARASSQLFKCPASNADIIYVFSPRFDPVSRSVARPCPISPLLKPVSLAALSIPFPSPELLRSCAPYIRHIGPLKF